MVPIITGRTGLVVGDMRALVGVIIMVPMVMVPMAMVVVPMIITDKVH